MSLSNTASAPSKVTFVHSENSMETDPNNRLVMNGYSPYSTVTGSTQPAIVTDIERLPIETEIIAKAKEIYFNINNRRINDNRGNAVEISKRTKAIKGSRKNRLIFYCV